MFLLTYQKAISPYDFFASIKSPYDTAKSRCGEPNLKFILFKSNLENSSSHKNFLNWAAYLRASSAQICGPIEGKFLWLNEFSKLFLNKMDFSCQFASVLIGRKESSRTKKGLGSFFPWNTPTTIYVSRWLEPLPLPI